MLQATSSLDASTEKDIMESLHNLALDRTAIVIAHRLSTVMGADKIIVLDKGQVALHLVLLLLLLLLACRLWRVARIAIYCRFRMACMQSCGPSSRIANMRRTR